MKNLTNEQIGNNMKAMRVKANMTQQEVAEKLGVNRVTVLNWENKPGTVSIKIFVDLANTYKCNVADFFMV